MNSEMKRRAKNYIEKKVAEEQSYQVTVYQERPYTCVVLSITFEGMTISGVVGFSKVMWTDEWDEGRGIDIAVTRAIRKFACDWVSAKFVKSSKQNDEVNDFLYNINRVIEAHKNKPQKTAVY